MNWKLILLLVVALAFSGLYIAFLTKEAQVSALQRQQVTEALARTSAVLDQQQQAFTQMREINNQIQADFQHTQDAVDRLSQHFRPQTLRQLPASVLQAQANQDTVWTLRCNALQTGATKLPSDAGNQICPELVQ